ncbi:MAG: CHRD domain-containing protein [Acidimicrobiia bacterium]
MLRRLLKIGVASFLFVAALPIPAMADDAEFGARLKPSQEVPPTDSDGDGEVEFTLRRDRVRFELEWEDLTSDVIMAHIHCAPAGVNGPVGVTLLMETRDPDDRIRGSFTGPDADNGCGWATLGDVIAAVVDGNAYVNVHTTQFTGGEIRGQLKIRPLELETEMDPSQENPPTASEGEGEADIKVRRDQARFKLEWGDLTSDVIMAHIHCGVVGMNGPIGVTLLMEPRDPDDRIRGSFTGPDGDNACGWASLGDVVGAVVDGNAYVNVHTTQFTGGEIRGQLEID